MCKPCRVVVWSLGIVVGLLCAAAGADEPKRPNIVWIIVDDMSANFSCYGETLIATPNVDRLAREGVRFENAFVTAPVCSACRSALITGMYQTAIGAHHHRSGRGELKITLPGDVVPIPVLFKKAGYYTCIGTPEGKQGARGKTDYNFQWDATMYDGADWSGRKPGQPFFMQVQLQGGKHREGARWTERVQQRLGSLTPTSNIKLPPYYPHDEVLVADWARYLDTCRWTDHEVGEVIDRLEEEGILDQTLVIFMTDHGISHARGKQFLYDEGTHVPLVMRGPGISPGQVRRDLVEHIDLAAVSLAAAGIEIPAWMQAKNILAKDYQPREAVFAARDRCDETVDRIRSVRTDKYLYIRNFYPERPMLQPNAYKDAKVILKRLRLLKMQEQLTGLQDRVLFAASRPPEELYAWTTDEHQTENLAENPDYQEVLAEMRSRLDRWIETSPDLGATPESDAMYESEMDVYRKQASKSAERLRTIEANIATMKQWAKEGK